MRTILIVDDEKQVLGLYERFLVMKGFKVIAAPGGKEGIEALESGAKIDLVIADIKMPKISGFDVIEKASEKNIRSVIVSGIIGTEMMEEHIRNLGYTREVILSKPVDMGELLNTINKILPPETKK